MTSWRHQTWPKNSSASHTWAGVGHADSQAPLRNQNLHFLPDAQAPGEGLGFCTSHPEAPQEWAPERAPSFHPAPIKGQRLTWPGSRGGSLSAPGDPRLLLASSKLLAPRVGATQRSWSWPLHPLQSLAQRPFRKSRTRDTVSLQELLDSWTRDPPTGTHLAVTAQRSCPEQEVVGT